MKDFKRALDLLGKGKAVTLAEAPDGFDALVCADLARGFARASETRSVALVHVARDRERSRAFIEALGFFAPELEALDFPSWDCQPYDRVSPNAAVVARRMTVLSRLARSRSSVERPRILCLTVNSLTQRVAPKDWVAQESFSAAPGNAVSTDDLARWLETNGFSRASTVRDTGDYAVRGGIVDLFPPGLPSPIRLDFFGDTLESIRPFDPETQRSTGQSRALDLVPMSEATLTTESMKRFRQAYVAAFGAQTRGDGLYDAVSEGRRHPGMEHWLPLFYPAMSTLFDYIGDAPLALDPLVDEAALERLTQVNDHYEARRQLYDKDAAHAAYKPLPPDALYLTEGEWRERIAGAPVARLTSLARPEGADVVDCGGAPGRSFAPERANPDANVFEASVEHIHALQAEKKRVIVAAYSDGARDRLSTVLREHGLKRAEPVATFAQLERLDPAAVGFAVIALESGFSAPGFTVLGEQDILGDRLVRQRRKTRRAQDFLSEAASLSAGDLVVHVDHGVGRFIGLRAIHAAGAPHDCLEIHYEGGDKLFLPVENLELLSRYGSEDADAKLDRLGGGAWQNRRARMRKRVLDMAQGLIDIAAQRQTREAPRLVPPEGIYDEFAARFPYDATEDQQSAIDACLDDLAAGRPMDRLVCGDVGFGKTEVALRATFAVAINGRQVAVIAPTTLLARQHARNFSERFKGLPIKVAQLSRMTTAAEQRETKVGLASGDVDIVIGTHAVLSKTVSFRDLALVIIDEEQHFGVVHKEKLKEMRAEVHMLTLSATPLPRTMQLALTGVREMSIIATPPVDRLAVRSFVMPFDELSVREALLRERYRGGQAFYVCPRIEDIQDVTTFLAKSVPEVKVVVAHGQMTPTELEDKMSAFYDGKYDVLVSTAIVESGLDIPTANTLIVHRADNFGLAQLYQLRGRVGRAKTRAYALFTTPAEKTITPQAEKRLAVLQSLDTLGAGFQLASHDLDIRGAGNLLGDEQSGHIREVGYELYQQMLTDAVNALKAGIVAPIEEVWSPTITTGAPVTIPEHYVPDLQLRMQIYRRLSNLDDDAEIESFGAEMIDRFGPMPSEVELLMKLMGVKALCRRAHVEKLDAGPKGVTIAFRDNSFANPQGLVRYVSQQGRDAKVRPDMKVVFIRDFDTPEERLEGARQIMRALVGIAEKKAA